MDAIGNDGRRKPRVGEHFADNPWSAMIKRPHRVKRVGGVSRARSYTGARGIQIGIGMSQADAHASSRRLRNHFLGAFQFRRNRHYANVTTRRLPEAVERRQGRQLKISRRMRTAPDMTEKGTLQMDAQRPGSLPARIVVPRRAFNRIRQSVEGRPGLLRRGRHRGWKKTGYAMFEKQLLDRAKL